MPQTSKEFVVMNAPYRRLCDKQIPQDRVPESPFASLNRLVDGGRAATNGPDRR